MDYTIDAIETKYMGYKFRSRLEAKWAAFFTLLGWKWEYEPVDFKGWMPDFAIYGKNIIYVEVKPVVEFPADVAKKTDKSGCENEVLIVGSTFPLPGSCDNNAPVIGWLNEKEGCGWEEALMGRWADGGGTWGFCHSVGSYTDRISGGYDGGHLGDIGDFTDDEHAITRRIWAEACNEVRWEKC